MKNLFTILVFLLSAFIFSNNCFGCIISNKPVKKFDLNKYVFTGEVIGYTRIYRKERVASSDSSKTDEKNTKEKSRKTDAKVEKIYKEWFNEPLIVIGLKVRPFEIINSPENTEEYFEIIPLTLHTTCNYLGRYQTKEQIAKDFPIGINVSVTGFKCYTFPNSADARNLRLDVNFPQLLFQNDSLKDQKTFSLTFNYQEFKKGNQLSAKLVLFELEKDLKRLEFDYDETRMDVLKRLVYFPFSEVIDYDALVKTYIPEGNLNRTIFPKLRKEFLAPKTN